MRTGHRTSARAALLVVAGALCGAATAAAAGTAAIPRVVVMGGSARFAHFGVRPARIVYSGDGAALLAGPGTMHRDIVWSRWGERAGSGRGEDWHDNCRPDCARGRFRPYPVTIRVYRPRRVGGHLLFTRMTTTYTGVHPPDPGFRRGAVTYTLYYSAHYRSFYWQTPT